MNNERDEKNGEAVIGAESSSLPSSNFNTVKDTIEEVIMEMGEVQKQLSAEIKSVEQLKRIKRGHEQNANDDKYNKGIDEETNDKSKKDGQENFEAGNDVLSAYAPYPFSSSIREKKNDESRTGRKEKFNPCDTNVLHKLIERVELLETQNGVIELIRTEMKEIKSSIQQLKSMTQCFEETKTQDKDIVNNNNNDSNKEDRELQDLQEYDSKESPKYTDEGRDIEIVSVVDSELPIRTQAKMMKSRNLSRRVMNSSFYEHLGMTEETQESTLGEDSYNFMVCSETFSTPFNLGLLIFLIQFAMLFMLYMYYWKKRKDIIEPDISVESKIIQYLSTLIAIITQNDLRLAIKQIHEGFSEDIRVKFIHSRSWKWYFVAILRLIVGAMGLFATFVLIIESTDPLEILLNFAGLEVLFQLDDTTYELSLTGIFGKTNQSKATEIETTKYIKKNRSSVAQLVMISATLFSSAILVVIHWLQINNFYILKTIDVQFADNAVADFGGYSGKYIVDTSNPHKKFYDYSPYYEERGIKREDGKMIAFCFDLKCWTLSERKNNNPCEDYLARSGLVEEKNVELAQNTLWTAINLFPLDYVVIDEFLLKENNISNKCTQLVASERMFNKEPMEVERSLKMMVDERGNEIEAYNNPIFIEDAFSSNLTSVHYDLILFTGRRWISTNTRHLRNYTDERKNVEDYFMRYNGFHVSDLLENAVISISDPTYTYTSPIDVQWYNAKYSEFGDGLEIIPKANANAFDPQPVICAICDNEGNPCRNGGQCEEGICKCFYGASGALCHNPFEVDGCVLQKLIDSNLKIDFDFYKEALFLPLSQDDGLGCSYETWDQRYILSILLHSMSHSSILQANINECSFTEINCNSSDSSIRTIKLEGANGLIPSEMSLLTTLQECTIRQGSLNGTIPTEVASLNNLVKLDFNRNKLVGQIPTEIGFMTKLTFLSLWQNKLTGTLPTELGLLTKMEIVYLDTNNLEGSIPSELGRMTALKKLYVESNKLSGEIPTELGLLTMLETLHMNINSLTGRIPSELGPLINTGQLTMKTVGNTNLTPMNLTTDR